jgi:propionyl-CoA synthetase
VRSWSSWCARIGPAASFRLAAQVTKLPKTRSGKIVRGTIKKIADGVPWTMPGRSTTGTLDDMARALASLGYPPSRSA